MQDLFTHEALPYAGRAAFVSSCAHVVHDGLRRDERVILLAAGEKLDGVRDELGADAEDVTFVATDEHGRNPSRITTMLHSFQATGDGRHCTGVNETVHRGRRGAAHVEAQLSDSMLNDPALRSWPLSVICLYDTSELDDEALTSMQQSHAHIRGHGPSRQYRPDLAARMYSARLDPPPAGATRLSVDADQLAGMRAMVRAGANRFAIAADRVDDLVLAANEIVTNSLRHGGGYARVCLWFDEGALVCEVADDGHLGDPLAGRFAPIPRATSGRGLWMANHLCDLVQVRSSETGTVVRMHIER